MPIEFARAQFITRSKGHSVVAAAAYRGAEKIYDERLGVSHNYEKKRGVLYNQVLLPEGACSSLDNPNALWNLVEQTEGRKNSQLARELVLALPADKTISHQDRINLTHRFVHTHFTSQGLAAQVAIHEPHNGSNNIHAHILVTTRRLHGQVFDKKKARDLLPEVRGGRVLKEEKIWKDYWRETQNQYFLEKGLDLEVDPAGMISQLHLGKGATHSPDQRDNERVQENAKRHLEAAQLVKTHPEHLLALLTKQQSVFSDIAICKLVHRYTSTREDYEETLDKLLASKALIALGENEQGRQCYTTKAMLALEQNISKLANKLKSHKSHSIPLPVLESLLNQSTLSSSQQMAVKHIINGPNIAALVGHAGAGKSYTMKVANDIWAGHGRCVLGLSFSKKAALNLENESGIQSRTIHSFLYGLDKGHIKLDKKSVLVVDEAGMVNAELFDKILQAVKTADAKVVLVGDPKQLQPIGPGAPFRAISEEVGFCELNEIRRQKVLWQRQASMELAAQETMAGFERYVEAGRVSFLSNEKEAFRDVALQYIKDRQNGKRAVILAAKNSEVNELNDAVRAELKLKKQLATDYDFATEKGVRPFAAGDSILLQKNDAKLGLSNGETAVVTKASHNQLTVSLDKGREVTINARQYPHINHGYAMTVHKAQGSTYQRAHVYLGSWGWNKQTAYVAFTRHQEDLNIYTSKSAFRHVADLAQTLSQSGLKESVLDYKAQFARRRGLARLKTYSQDLIVKAQQLATDIKSKAQVFGAKAEAHPNDTERGGDKAAQLIQKGTRKRLIVIADCLENAQVLAEANPEHSVWVAKGSLDAKAVFEGYRVRPDAVLVAKSEQHQSWAQKTAATIANKARNITMMHEPQSLKQFVAQKGKLALTSRLKKAKLLSVQKAQSLDLSLH